MARDPKDRTITDLEKDKFDLNVNDEVCVRTCIDGTVTTTPGGAENIKITNLAITTPNSEQSHSLTTNLKTLIIRSRGLANAQISFTATESGTKFFTIPRGTTFRQEHLNFSGETLYVQCDKTTTMEILEFY